MRCRRRTFIPMIYRGQQIGHLLWNGEAMEVRTTEGELIGQYPTRHEAAAALWTMTAIQRKEIRKAAL